MSSYVSVLNDEYKDVHVVLKNHFYVHFEQNQVQTGPKLTSCYQKQAFLEISYLTEFEVSVDSKIIPKITI